MTPHEKTAREIADEFLSLSADHVFKRSLIEAIVAALSRTEAATLRRAAEVAMEMFARYDEMHQEAIREPPDMVLAQAWSIGMTSASKIADRLRALAEETPK